MKRERPRRWALRRRSACRGRGRGARPCARTRGSRTRPGRSAAGPAAGSRCASTIAAASAPIGSERAADQHQRVARAHDEHQRLEAGAGSADAEARERAREPCRPAAAARRARTDDGRRAAPGADQEHVATTPAARARRALRATPARSPRTPRPPRSRARSDAPAIGAVDMGVAACMGPLLRLPEMRVSRATGSLWQQPRPPGGTAAGRSVRQVAHV